MKRFVALFVFLTLIVWRNYGQSLTLQSDVYVDSFPQVRFVVNVFSPDSLGKEAFELTEQGNKRDFDIQLLDKATDEEKPRAILFLVEDMTHPDHAGQRKTFKYILQTALPETAKENDSVNIAYFDRNRDGTTPLRFLSKSYTKDINRLLDKLENYNPPADRFNRQKSSDLYNAVYDGILDLSKKFPGKDKILVVLSAGKNLELSNYNSIGDLILLARKHKVAIYSMQYMVYEHENIDMLAHQTTGKVFHIEGAYPIDGSHDRQTAADSLISFMAQASKRLAGRNYEIRYVSSFDRDGKLHTLSLKALGESLNIPVKVPSCYLRCLVKKYPYRSAAAGGGLLAVLVLLTIWIKRRQKRRKKLIEEQEQAIMQQLQLQRQALEDQKRKTEEMKRQAELEKKRREEELRRQRQAEERKRQIEFMKKTGGFPRLKIFHNNQAMDFVISEPVVTFGRAPGNHIQVPSRFVSSKHFMIYFKDGEYYIKDLGSSNGTVVNGRKISEKKLQRNDAIQIGDLKILFIKP